MLNVKNRKFSNEGYLKFIRRLPCSVNGKCGVDAHHSDVVGRQGIKNDYYAVPLDHFLHTGGSHITQGRYRELIKEPITERVIFYMTLYIEYLEGKYDIDADESCQFVDLRRKLEGINK